MLPHDELYHYGVKGMKWGVRRYGKALGEGAKLGVRHPILQDRAYKESMAKQSRATRARRLSLFSKTSEIEDMNRRTKRMINEKKQQRLAKRQQKLDKTLKKPFKKPYDKRQREIFEKALITGGIGLAIGTGGIAGRLIGPTADMFGKRLATFVASKTTKTAAKTGMAAAEELFKYIK